MLNRLTIRNLRLIRRLDLDFVPGVPVVLIGPNSSGKSSVLEAVDILGRLESDGTTHLFDGWRGGVQAVRTAGVAEPVEIGVHWGSSHDDADGVFSYVVQFDQIPPNGASVVVSETLGLAPAFGPFQTWIRRDGMIVTVDPGGKNERLQLSNALFPVWVHIRHPIEFDWLATIGGEISSYSVYTGFDVQPRWANRANDRRSARESRPMQEGDLLDAHGSNLVNVLYTLYTHHEPAFERLLHHFQQEFPHVSRIRFPAGPVVGTVQMQWTDHRFPGVQLHTDQMSTGMLQFLCLLAALYQPGEVQLVAFDEPDAHLHPSAIARLVAVAEEVSHERAVLIATHSDAVLDALTDPSGVHICTPSADGTEVVPVQADALAAFRDAYSLSELREQGLLDASNVDGAA